MGCEELKIPMPSDDQIAANIANAQKSTGPTTEKGKHRTRLNAFRHGLTGQICVVTPEEQAAFDKHCNAIREALKPVGALETDIAQSIAEDRWRLNRARALESGIFALRQHNEKDCDTASQLRTDESFSQAWTWLRDGKDLQLLSLYEQRIHRAVEKNTAQLRTLQTERKAARQQALEEAQLLAQLAATKGEAYDPAPDFPPDLLEIGSDCSTTGFNLLIARNQRLTEARHYAKNHWDQLPKAA
jgi:hypothetical protein